MKTAPNKPVFLTVGPPAFALDTVPCSGRPVRVRC